MAVAENGLFWPDLDSARRDLKTLFSTLSEKYVGKRLYKSLYQASLRNPPKIFLFYRNGFWGYLAHRQTFPTSIPDSVKRFLLKAGATVLHLQTAVTEGAMLQPKPDTSMQWAHDVNSFPASSLEHTVSCVSDRSTVGCHFVILGSNSIQRRDPAAFEWH